MSHYSLVKNALIADVKSRCMIDADILINVSEGGLIERIGQSLEAPESSVVSVINAQGHIVCPAFTDLHTYTGEPAHGSRDTIAATLNSALYGGYRKILIMPEIPSETKEDAVVKYLSSHRPSSCPCKALIAAPISKVNKYGEALTDFARLIEDGAYALTNDGCADISSALLRAAMLQAKNMKRPLIIRCNDLSLSGGKSINAGPVANMLGQKGIPRSAELVSLARAIVLALETECPVHFALVSTSDGLEMIRQAKKRGANITCSVSYSSFAFSENDLIFYGNNAKLDPPLRAESDRQAVIEAIADRTVDVISSNHTPCAENEKSKDMASAPFGAVSLQCVFSAVNEVLIKSGAIDIFRMTELLSYNPAAVLYEKVGIEEGMPADLNIISLDKGVRITSDYLKSRAKNTPYLNTEMTGAVLTTLIGGKKADKDNTSKRK